MYLRARNVSIQFPMQSRTPLTTPVSQAGKLGGEVREHDGRQWVHALEDISLDLQQGDRLALVGHNGAGKSTLLRVLAGIYHPQRGFVECDRPVSGLFNSSLGFRQEASGFRNIVLKGLVAGKSRVEIDRAIPEVVEFTELGPYLHMPLRTYSQGMAMRLAFAISTVFSSEVLLMDEWVGAGDAHFREKVVARMNSMVEAAHIVVIASHSAQLLNRVANKAIWLQGGRIREAGPAAEVIGHYEAEVREQARKVELEARGPIRREWIRLRVQLVADDVEQHRQRIGEVTWDVAGSGLERVEILLVRADGSTVPFARGGQAGSKMTGRWLVPGVEFQLREPDTTDVLASAVVA